jgi:hypothetical protein
VHCSIKIFEPQLCMKPRGERLEIFVRIELHSTPQRPTVSISTLYQNDQVSDLWEFLLFPSKFKCPKVVAFYFDWLNLKFGEFLDLFQFSLRSDFPDFKLFSFFTPWL